MKKTLLLLLFSMNIVAALATYHEPYNSSRIFWDTASRKVVFNSGGYARMIELQDGRYMATTETAGINIIFSSDKGNSWSGEKKIVENINNTPNCVPDLIQLKDGTIVVGYNPRPSTPYTEDRRFGIRCKRSTDNGRTWSNEIFINDASFTYQDGCWEPSFLELPSGELQCYFADEGPYINSGEQQISMCRSFDGGQTWGKAEIVCFRKNYRDGMPVPVILHDGQTICVAIEDNGWSGFGAFVPTTVRCPLETNWNGFWVDANSSYRDRSVNYTLCPRALGGAPYLRVLPWGETIMSHQSDYGDGDWQMYIYVGNEEAKDFKAMSSPFPLSGTDRAMWNSVAVVDTGVVVAVAGLNGKVEMMKGYPVRQLQAPFASTIKVDGKQPTNEGYYKRNASQIILGTENGVRFTGDFAYDRDSLYFTSRVSDRTQQPSSGTSFADGVQLYIDLDNRCETQPVDGCYRFFLRLDGHVQAYQGLDTRRRWNNIDDEGVHLAVTNSSTYYIVEAAIPWTFFGLDFPPVGRDMRVMPELWDKRKATDTSVYKEAFPDGNFLASWTYMAFRLIESDLLGIEAPTSPDPSQEGEECLPGCTQVYNIAGQRISSTANSHHSKYNNIIIRNGKKYMK